MCSWFSIKKFQAWISVNVFARCFPLNVFKSTTSLNVLYLPNHYFSLSAATSILKKAKRSRRGNVQFDQVTVFFFPRCQGFTSVPSRGGCTLGMVQRHSAQRRYSIAEFAIAQRHLRQEKIKNRLKEEKLEALKLKVFLSWIFSVLSDMRF